MSLFERLGLLVLGLVLFLPGIGGRDLWNPDEPRYAEVTREMRQSGDFFVPHLNGKIYSEKPPLLFWSIAAASLATGEVGPVAARLPSLAAAIVTLFLLFGMAQRLFDRRVAWWSVAILATSGRILWQARVGQIDMLLLCLVTRWAMPRRSAISPKTSCCSKPSGSTRSLSTAVGRRSARC